MLNENLNETQFEIKRWINRLDDIAVDFESVWGIGNLEKFCNAGTAEKFKAQNDKLANAIRSQDLRSVQELVKGFERAYSVMEKEARENGHKPITPEYMEIKIDGDFILRIAKTATQARACVQDGVYVYSLKEVARIIKSDYTLVNVVKENFPASQVEEITNFDFEAGDEINI